MSGTRYKWLSDYNCFKYNTYWSWKIKYKSSSLVTATILNTKTGEAKNKIPDHPKYRTTHKFKKLTAGNFAARLKQANLVNKTNFGDNLISFVRK